MHERCRARKLIERGIKRERRGEERGENRERRGRERGGGENRERGARVAERTKEGDGKDRADRGFKQHCHGVCKEGWLRRGSLPAIAERESQKL